MTMAEKKARTGSPITPLLAERFSTRAFDPDRPVLFGTLLSLFEAARWAPSSFNDQPWRFIFWNRFYDREGWQKAFDCLTPGNRLWAKNAQILVATVARDHFSHDRSPNRWGGHDTGMATMALLVEAQAQGLAAHVMGGFDPERLRGEFGIPVDFHPMTMIAIGYAGSPALLDPDLAAREAGERTREPLDRILFEGAWAQPVRDRQNPPTP